MENAKNMARVVAKAWTDPEYKKRLLTNPAKVLKAEGVKTPKGAKVHLHENTAKEVHIVLPKRPAEPLAEDELNQRAGGQGYHTLITCH